jgi:parallel beta helix pectate lyase-like protein/uncharacterized protein DUF1565
MKKTLISTMGMALLFGAVGCTSSGDDFTTDADRTKGRWKDMGSGTGGSGSTGGSADMSTSGSTGGSSDMATGGSAPAQPPPAAPVNYTCTRSFHVATTGSDTNSGSDTAPFKTIAKATPLAQPGDCVLVHAGTYPETKTISFGRDGTSTAPIVLRSVDGPRAAIIDGKNYSSGPTLEVRYNYIVVDGFEFKNTPLTGDHVVHFDGMGAGKGVGSVLRNSKITGGYTHLKINANSYGITIENNEIYGSFGFIPISLTSASGLTFRGNFLHDWNSGGNGAIQLKGGSHDVLFEGNRFQDIASQAGALSLGDGCDASCDIDPEHYAGVRVKAINNVMVRVGRAFDMAGCKDCALLSNTIIDSGAGNVTFKLTSATTGGVTHDTVNARLQDNLLSNSQGNMGNVVQINGASVNGLQMDYNLVWNNGGSVNWGDGHPATADTHSLKVNPMLTAPSSGDYTPAAGSPAIGKGVNLYSDVPRDYSGAARPTSGGFDIGALQSR